MTTGKGAKKKTFNALVITGEWPKEDQRSLLENNPEKKESDEGEEIDKRQQRLGDYVRLGNALLLPHPCRMAEGSQGVCGLSRPNL